MFKISSKVSRYVPIFVKSRLYSVAESQNVATKFAYIKDKVFSTELETLKTVINSDLRLYVDFVTGNEELGLMKEIDRAFRRTKYEYEHWDGAIHGYRETEKSRWSESNEIIIDRIKTIAFGSKIDMIPATHVLDLAKDGHICPHTDSIRFCGTTIAGLNLLSSAVMRFCHNKKKHISMDVLLPQHSLYVMKNSLRFDFTHEILPEASSYWRDEFVQRGRRISVLLRNEPVK